MVLVMLMMRVVLVLMVLKVLLVLTRILIPTWMVMMMMMTTWNLKLWTQSTNHSAKEKSRESKLAIWWVVQGQKKNMRLWSFKRHELWHISIYICIYVRLFYTNSLGGPFFACLLEENHFHSHVLEQPNRSRIQVGHEKRPKSDPPLGTKSNSVQIKQLEKIPSLTSQFEDGIPPRKSTLKGHGGFFSGGCKFCDLKNWLIQID